LLPTSAVLWRVATASAPGGLAVENLQGHLEALSALAADLDARVATAGLDGLAGALEVYRRVHAVLDPIDLAQIERTLADLAALVDGLEGLAKQLEALRRLKGLLAS
jgi:H2-forming N5,N10-methylenetetrahydromethanopterin dehydrogenase-like enzyme